MGESMVNSAEWTRVAFGDVVRLCKERSRDPAADGFERYVGLEHLDPGELKIRRWGNVDDGTTFTNVFRPGHVLFGKRRAYQRKLAVADFSGVCSGDIYVLASADPKVLLPALLPHVCQTDAFFDYAVGTSAGSLSPRTNWRSLASYEFALPPATQQRGISEVLQLAQSATENIRYLIHAVSTCRKSIIYDFESHADPAQMTTLTSIGIDLEAGKSPPSPGRPAEMGEPGVLKVSAVGDWEFLAHENKVVSQSVFRPDLAVGHGDLLATRANADPAAVGRTCAVAEPHPNLMLSDKTWRVRIPHDSEYSTEPILAWSKSRSFRTHVRNHLSGTDAKNISQTNFLAGPIPVWSDDFAALSERVSEMSIRLSELQSRRSLLNDLTTAMRRSVMTP